MSLLDPPGLTKAAADATYIRGVISDTAPTSLPVGAVWMTTRVDTTPPTVPTGVAAVGDATGISVTWNPSTDDSGAVAGYRVYRAISGGAAALVGTASSTSFRDTTAAASTAYTYTVAALDPFGNASAQSSASASTQLIDSMFPAADKAWEFVASDLNLADGAAVTSLPNRISGGPALASGDGISGHASSPTYRTGLRSRPVIVFDGVDDFMGADTGIVAQPRTRIFIGALATTGAGKVLVGTRISGANRQVMAQSSSVTRWNAFAGTNLAHSANTDTGLHMVAIVFNGTSSIIYVDGVAVTGSAGTEGANGIRVGATSSASGALPTGFTNSHLGAMAAYSRALTVSELDSIRSNAKARWSDLP